MKTKLTKTCEQCGNKISPQEARQAETISGSGLTLCYQCGVAFDEQMNQHAEQISGLPKGTYSHSKE